jgi:serine/threonine-protein kinase
MQGIEPPFALAERYEVIERVGSGGMASVWRATDTVLGRDVAVKFLHEHLARDPASSSGSVARPCPRPA